MKILPPLLAGLSLLGTVATSQAVNYNGNGNTGFGGALGGGLLSITSTSTNINFSFSSSAGFTGNDIVIYIDSVTGGVNSTSSFTDNADGGRTAVSGFSGSGRTLATFAPGFNADYAISFEPTFAGLFNLSTPSNFNALGSGNLTGSGSGPFTFTFSRALLGLSATAGFTFEATLISTSGYRSNETIGTSLTTPGTAPDSPNAGFAGTQTFSASNVFPAVPEPGTLVSLGFGAAALAGFGRRRSRRS